MTPDEVTGAYTPAAPAPPAAATRSSDRFSPGGLLAGRYRIVAALGKGGMGEVYRADDLTLGQPVALKFLPALVAADPGRLARFRKEAAAARRVSHPNVCRVHDIADHDGQPFLTMEFIDGEDLSSLLRRVSRLPEEKGIEIARQLCGALAAVHDAGLLHRDLKPANVMLDGRGKVRLADFGLAAAAEDLSATEVRSGTPLYQAPEQLAGREVTARSDVFALGLILYEVFTGKRAYAGAGRDVPPSRPSSHVSGLNPAVERVVLKCLESDPANRPRSAADVLALLPGGDPLAAALAAGETPSPQAVADAGEVGLIRPWVGLALFAAVVLGVAASAAAWRYNALARRIPLASSPDEMGRKARAVLAEAGYTDPPGDSAGLYWAHGDWLRGAADRDPDWQSRLSPDDPAVTFDYREGPGRLHPTSLDAVRPMLVTLDNPPPTRPGLAGVRLTPSGRLVEFYAVPVADTPARRAPLPAEPWRRLFAAAGLEFDRFRPDAPTRVAPVGCDERLAWVEREPRPDGSAVRVEAARCGDRPVFFRVDDGRTPNPAPYDEALGLVGALASGAFLLAALLAGRNLLKGRADRRTLARMCLAVLVVQVVSWVAGGRPSSSRLDVQVTLVAGRVAAYALVLGGFYLSLEPLVRRRWPWRLTGWQRLFDGRLRDPLVGRDILVGSAVGAAVASAMAVLQLGTPVLVGVARSEPAVPGVHEVLSEGVCGAMLSPLLFLVMAYLVFLVVRREKLAWPLWVGCMCLPMLAATAGEPAGTAAAHVAAVGVLYAGWAVAVARFGLLAGAAFSLVQNFTGLTILRADWYAPTSLAFAGGVVVLGAACFYTATGGQRLFKEGFFGDE